jgi:hypothetical protein
MALLKDTLESGHFREEMWIRVIEVTQEVTVYCLTKVDCTFYYSKLFEQYFFSNLSC